MTPEEKVARKRQRMIEKAKEYQTSTYSRKFVAPVFQRMIRAEAAALEAGETPVVLFHEMTTVFRRVGQLACVTCGNKFPWDYGIKGMHTGHFLASRRNSILFEEQNVAPQCSHCNYFASGASQEFRKWMLAVRGPDAVERLERLKQQSVSFSREELVDMRIGFTKRLRAAEERMKE